MFACFYNRGSSRKDTDEGRGKLTDHSLHNMSEYRKEHLDEGEDLRHQTSAAVSPSYLPSGQAVRDTKSFNGEENFKNDLDESEEDRGEYEYYEEEEECEEEYELPLRLCLGEEGRIGMIDVRLIGKELHVMLEDAVITIEAIPIIPKDDNTENDRAQENTNSVASGEMQSDDNGNEKTTDSGKNTEVNGDSDTDNTSSKDEKSTTEPKTESKRDTVYDRVLADNRLARIISAIPHLFLRDVNIRIIVRNEPMRPTSEENVENGGSHSTSTSSSTTANNYLDGYTKPQPSSKDTMVEVGIDFLSVTSGEDILSHFQQEHTTSEEELAILNNKSKYLEETNHSKRSALTVDTASTKPPTLLNIPSNIADANGEQNNEYLVRHIRTGRGPSAGIFVQIFTPNSNLPKLVTKSAASSGILWARQHWISATENHLLRCSGVDIQARIHMGTKREDAGYSWFYGEYVDGQDANSEIDSMILFGGGMDTVAPGPQLPLPRIEPRPPAEPHMSRGSTPSRRKPRNIYEDQARVESETRKTYESSIQPGVDVYSVDANGIQSCKVPSFFHRVSRGMEIKSCKDCKHLPSDVCDLCWEIPPNSDVKKDSPLDASIPMPGLVLQIGIRDPLEINVDRNSIESIGLIKSLFTKPSNPETINDGNTNKESTKGKSNTEATVRPSNSEDTTQSTTTSTGFFSGLLYGKQEETIQEEEIPVNSFESYMQPESISVLGIYLAKATIRIHVMREGQNDRNLSFCYWQIDTNCLTIDRHALATSKKRFSDLRLDIGRLVGDEYRGIGRKNLVSLGAHSNILRCDSQISLLSMIDDHAQNKTPWPSTACALLDIPPPLESLAYRSREGHGLQFRFISTPSSTGSNPDEVSKSIIHLRLGLTTVDSSWDIRNDIRLLISEIMKIIFGPKKKASQTAANEAKEADNARSNTNDEAVSNKAGTENEQVKPRSLMTYTIQVDSGNISLPPLIQAKMPMTRFSGERSSLAGFSIESVLGKINFSYGSKEPQKIEKRCLSLSQIASIPEHVRMHILLCLEDTSALEQALNVKKERNSFRRIKAVDKAILKMAKKITKRTAKVTSKKKLNGRHPSLSSRENLLDASSRRHNILTEIMKLDDAELSNLWSVHQRYKKKLAKKLQEERMEGKLHTTLFSTEEK
uniref:Uncharacterized protein n=1 Tax=Pseudo-nitzschia australis TaxID=44445 RepID=A0A7S4ABL3_9STRA